MTRTKESEEKKDDDNIERDIYQQNYHHVIITDEKGIYSSFEHLKNKLAENTDSFLTLIYFNSNINESLLFREELNAIELRFLYRLIVYFIPYEECTILNQLEKFQKILETLLNSNTKKFMQFQISGDKDLSEFALDRLIFLGVDKQQIVSQVIC